MSQAPLETPTTATAVAVLGVTHRYPARKARPRRSRSAAPAPLNESRISDKPALEGVNLTILPRQIFGILGPNGGGKSTLFRILTTMLRPTTGDVEIFSHSAKSEPANVRRQIGVVFQNPSLDGKLTGRENLHHHGHLYGLTGSTLRQRAEEFLKSFNLADRADEPADHYSGGMKRRLEIAKALLSHPRLLLLDEPSTGLDPGARLDLWSILKRLRDREGITVVLTTHFMDEADRCDNLAILDHGRLITQGTPDQLKGRIGGDVVTVDTASDEDAGRLTNEVIEKFGPWDGLDAPRAVGSSVLIERPDGPVFVAEVASAFPGRIKSITVGKPTLDDVFLQLTGHRLEDESPAK